MTQTQNKVDQVFMDGLAQLDASQLEKITKETNRTVPKPLSDALIRYAEAIFDRFTLKQCFPGKQADSMKMLSLYVALRDELAREKLHSVRAEADNATLVDACLTGDMAKIESALIVLGHKPIPGASLLQ